MLSVKIAPGYGAEEGAMRELSQSMRSENRGDILAILQAKADEGNAKAIDLLAEMEHLRAMFAAMQD